MPMRASDMHEEMLEKRAAACMSFYYLSTISFFYGLACAIRRPDLMHASKRCLTLSSVNREVL
jgi:hypothetical protein